jgi:putative ATP-dependent endonuclease of OLD family
MYLCELELENFRIFGKENERGSITFSKGITALVGGNDHGKTAVVDAIRLALSTSDLDYMRVALSDFNSATGEETSSKKFSIRCKFDDLTVHERGAFAEYLTYEKNQSEERTVHAVLYVNFIAKNNESFRHGRPFITTEVKSGEKADGLTLDQNGRSLLASTYLRPLRDAEREMSAGRGSRLSQILLSSEGINLNGEEVYTQGTDPQNVRNLGILGLGDYANDLLCEHEAIRGAQAKLNADYLEPLSFAGDVSASKISIGSGGNNKVRLRQLLEKLELQLEGTARGDVRHGLGSNNLLFMACELLLLGDESEASPLLLIEEPEAHLHPQRQLLLMQFLQEEAEKKDIQIILTTHSPNIASVLPLNNLVLMQKGKAFSLAEGQTELRKEDHRFLKRFLDVTKANLFFARGVMVVEGDAENILLPTLAKLLGRDFSKHGVSIVNVGSVGLGRYAKIFIRKNTADGEVGIPVACVTDLDVMPDCAPEIMGIKKNTKGKWPSTRRWLKLSDFPKDRQTLCEYRQEKIDKVKGQGVESFVSDKWTLEYDLADTELAEEIYVAAKLALNDDKICEETITKDAVEAEVRTDFSLIPNDEKRASEIYSLFAHKTHAKASKAIAAQYLAELLEADKYNEWKPEQWEKVLPDYLVDAIKHVTPMVEADPVLVAPEEDSHA